MMAAASRSVSRSLCSTYSKFLTNSSAFVQNGNKIREVPLIVRRLLDKPPSPAPLFKAGLDKGLLSRMDALSDTAGLIHLLETLQSNEVTPFIAKFALSKLVAFSTTGEEQEIIATPANINEGFARHAFTKRLLEIILAGVAQDPELLLDGLLLGTLELESAMDPLDAINFRRRLYEEALLSVADGRLGPCQISRAVVVIAEYFPDRGVKFRETDKFWPGILDKSEEITASNIATVCKALPHLKKSRDIVLRTIENKLEETFRELSTASALEILGILTSIDYGNARILGNLSEWIALNIQALSEKELGAFLVCFSSLEFTCRSFERTLERYVRARGVRISDPELVASISDYVLKFRLRNPPLLEGLSEYFVAHGESRLSPSQIHSVARTFGDLNYHPPNGFKFFDVLELSLEKHFAACRPQEVLHLLLSALYLEVHPLNFVEKVFSKGFSRRLEDLFPGERTEVDGLLRVFEACLRLDGYEGGSWRSFSGESYQYVNRNFRVSRAAKKVLGPLSEVVGGLERLEPDVVLSSLPLTPLYIIDLMVYPSAVAKFARFGRDTKNGLNTAVIIHPPEHYDSKGKFLIGQQATRIRHLRKMGFKIMELDLKRIYAMSRSEGQKLKEYLRESYDKAQKTD